MKSKKGGLFTLLISIGIIIGLLIAYMILNIWATYKLEVDTSSGEMINSINKLNIGLDSGKTMLNTTIKLTNPTLVPVMVTGVSYDVSYGDIKIGEGKTGFIFMMPKSSKEVPASIELDNANVRKALFSGIIDILSKDVKKISMKIYVGIGSLRLFVREI